MKRNFFKKLIVTGIIIATLLMPAAQPAQAIITFDPTTFATTVASYVTEITSYTTQVKGYVTKVADYALTAAQKFFDQSGYLKEYVLDPIAYILAQKSIQNISKSTLTAINKGSDGNPSFIQDLRGEVNDVGDKASEQFIKGLDNKKINAAFLSDIQTSLATYAVKKPSSALESTISETEFNKFSGNNGVKSDFTGAGGWDMWLNVTQNPANNPYGAQMLAKKAHDTEIAEAKDTFLTQVGYGGGYKPSTDSKGNVTTPGATVKAQLDTVLSSGVNRLNNADEISEVVAGLLANLVTHMLGSGGLKGLTRSQTGQTSGSYADQVANEQAPEITVKKPPVVTAPGEDVDADAPQLPDNIAIGNASQISTSQDDEAKKGFDQSIQDWSITQLEVRPWWELDILGQQAIKYVDVKERPNVGPVAALGQFRVFISKIPFSNQVNMTDTSEVAMISVDSFDPTVPPVGRSNSDDFTAGVNEDGNFWASPVMNANADGKNNPTKILVNYKGRYIRIQRVESTTRRNDRGETIPNRHYLQLASLLIYRNQPPVIKKKGVSPLTLQVGDTYIESSVDVTDDSDQNPKIEITYNKVNSKDDTLTDTDYIDTTKEGKYRVTYTVTDSGGASSATQRTVVVNNSSNGTVIDPNEAINIDSLMD